jgi:hypothetical protein
MPKLYQMGYYFKNVPYYFEKKKKWNYSIKCQGNEKMKKHFHIYILDDEE